MAAYKNPRLIDMIGWESQWARVVGKSPPEQYVQGLSWECECKCAGKRKFFAAGYALRSGQVKSCGCLRGPAVSASYKKAKGVVPFNIKSGGYKHAAKKRGLEWSLPDDVALQLFLGNCYYCDSPPSSICRSVSGLDSMIFNGIDRVDSSKGYSAGNCVSCCPMCNIAKNNHSLEKFLMHAQKIVSHSVTRIACQ